MHKNSMRSYGFWVVAFLVAKELVEDWYLQLRGKLRNGEIKTEKTFREASEQSLREYDIIRQGQRSQEYVEDQHGRSRLHLVPFFGNLGLSEITPGKIQVDTSQNTPWHGLA